MLKSTVVEKHHHPGCDSAKGTIPFMSYRRGKFQKGTLQLAARSSSAREVGRSRGWERTVPAWWCNVFVVVVFAQSSL